MRSPENAMSLSIRFIQFIQQTDRSLMNIRKSVMMTFNKMAKDTVIFYSVDVVIAITFV